MAIIDADYNSNTYFFLTNFSDVLKAGKNSFIINPTPYVVPNANIVVKAYDTANNELPCGEIKPTNALFSEQTNTGKFYYVNVADGSINGFGRLEIKSIGLNISLDFTGSIAYYEGNAYNVSKTTRLPLTKAPSTPPIEQMEIIWTRNILIDTTKKTDSEVRFFDSPSIIVRPEIYSLPSFPLSSYALASGSFSSIAISPKNNANGNYDYQFDEALYQLYWKSGVKFNSSMEGENIRLRNPKVTKFRYTNFGDNQITYEGILNTDFIAKIKRVVNESSILLDIPFATVSELIDKTNEDSPYAKNNFVKISGYTVNDDIEKQNVFYKKNFYVLSISDGQFEIFYKNIPVQVPVSEISGSSINSVSIDVEFNNIRVLCGNLCWYKIYGKSLNKPDSKTLLVEGKILADECILSKKFNNGLYNNPAHFYSAQYVADHWFVNGNCIFQHNNSVLIDGASIGHSDNSGLSDYVIFKDNTVSDSKNSTYYTYNLLTSSYWYANSEAFVNYSAYPTASYSGISGISTIQSYVNSQEVLLNGLAHDSNPIKLRKNTLYNFSMRVRSAPNNTNNSKLYVYYLSGGNKKMIGYVDSSYNYGANELYENAFFSEQQQFGTIILVPVQGDWNISTISIKPHQNIDYSIDSFSIKIPFPLRISNEFYEFEAELYDSQYRLAYGEDSYTFKYNSRFIPLKKRIFIDPSGISSTGTGAGSIILIDGGNA